MEDSIRQNNVRSFQLLLDAGVSPLYGNNYPVRLAASNGCNDILEILLKNQGVDPAAYQNEARKCNTQSNISIWMPWETQQTNNQPYLESFSELGVDRVIFLTTEAQHFNEIKQLGNFSFP
jgi:hypothetical protein